jgi:DNA-binding LacI/PurR family transcriptional regulator
MGITRSLKDNNVIVPEDMSLIVLQDNDTFKYSNPSLTALSFPKQELGQLAAQYLLNKIEKRRGDKTNKMLPIELIVRESTCKTKE